jgi:osmoprotectant transport system permease protein
VKDGQVDAIVAYTSDGRIPAFRLKLLDDTKRALPPYEALLLLSPEAGKRPDLRAALVPLKGAVSPEAMRRANWRVDEKNWPARQAAEKLYDEDEGEE